jgi:hypothetical protein
MPKAVAKVRFLGAQLTRQASVTKTLAETLAKLIPLERESYALDISEGEQSYESMLRELHNSTPDEPSNEPSEGGRIH